MKPESSVQAVIRLAEETAIDKGSMGTKWWSEPRQGIGPEPARVVHASQIGRDGNANPWNPEKTTAYLHQLETSFQTSHPVSLSCLRRNASFANS